MIAISQLLDFAKKHKAKLIPLAALAAAFGAGWFLHRPSPPQPAVQLHEEAKKDTNTSSATEDHKTTASRTIDIEIGEKPTSETQSKQPATQSRAPRAAVSASPQIDFTDGLDSEEIAELPPGSHVHIQEGPSTEDTKAVVNQEVKQETSLELKVTPPSLPKWSIGAGVEDPFGDRRVRFEVGRRIFDQVWVRAGETPSRGLAGLSVMAEVHF